MRRPLHAIRLVALALLLFGMPATAAGQDVPDDVAVPADTTQPRQADVAADSLVGMRLNGEAVRRLFGNVFVRQDSTTLLSHRAVQYLDRQTIIFVGDVLIVERGDSLRADSVFYDRRTKIGRATGHVYLTDGDVQARAPSGIYFTKEKRARFEEGVTLVDSTATLTSDTGTYWSDEKRAELAGTVRLRGDRTYLEADSLTYFRETDVSIARANVFIERQGGEEDAEADSTLRTLLFSQYAYTDEQAGVSRVRGHPVLVQLRQDSTDAEVDTLLIRAQRLESVEEDSVQRLIAVDSVRIWQRDFAAVADSLVYERFAEPAGTLAADTLATVASADTSLAAAPSEPEGRPEETRLFGHPIAWVEEAQVTGDTLRVTGRAGSLDSLFVRQNAFVAQRDSVTDRIHQLKGRYLVGVFENDSTRVFDVGPNAEVIYFQHDDEDRPDGGLRASGDRAVFRVQGEEPERITFVGEPQGTYYPESQLPRPFQLSGFRWVPEQRPTKARLVHEAWIIQRLKEYAHPPPPESPFQTVPPVEPSVPPSGEAQADMIDVDW